MKNKTFKIILITIIVIELFSLLLSFKDFFTLQTQGINLLYILFFILFILIEQKLKSKASKILAGNIYISVISLVCLGVSIYIILDLSPLINNPYSDPTFFIILMVILGILSLFNLIYIWIKFFKVIK